MPLHHRVIKRRKRAHVMKATLLLALLARTDAKACEGENLPPSAPLRIGKLYKPEQCTQQALPGDKLSMHYSGKLYSDCSKFDSSLDRDEPFEFTLGAGEVIRGWDDGLRGMCVGEKRKLTIPSDLAYGDNGSGDKIPGGSTLQFEVELLDIKHPPPKKQGGKKKKKKEKKKGKNPSQPVKDEP